MKISFALSALVAMAATAVSAASSSSPLSTRAEPCTPTSLFWNRVYKVDGNNQDPGRDLHAFELVVESKYRGTLSLRKTRGKGSNNYKETRTSDDKKWKVEHTDKWSGGRVTLTVKGKKHVFNEANNFRYGMKDWMIEYWTCVEW